MTHIQGIDEQEWTAMKWFVRGFIEGIKDTHTKEGWELKLEDYWHGWDNTIDLNIWMDGEVINCTAYAIKPDGYTDTEDFERLHYEDAHEEIL